jgi:hypothetical protein
VTATESVIVSEHIDRSLCLVIDAVEANPPRPGGGVEVTLYLPWASVMGSIEPCWYFDQQVLLFLQSIGFDHRNGPAGHNPERAKPNPHSHEYVHLSHAVYRLNGGDEDHHEQIRVRLGDVIAWTFGRGAHSMREHII